MDTIDNRLEPCPLADELEPCPNPWCKKSAPVVDEAYNGDGWFGRCRSCDIYTPFAATEAEAVAAWNTRAQPDRPADVVEAATRLQAWLDVEDATHFGQHEKDIETVLAALSNPAASDDLAAKFRNFVSHATGGRTDDITLPLNTLCVMATQKVNDAWEAALEKGREASHGD